MPKGFLPPDPQYKMKVKELLKLMDDMFGDRHINIKHTTMKEGERRNKTNQIKVNRYTRAGQGKLIHCPECDMPTKVYHFSWSALTCWKCKGMIDKTDWNLQSDYENNKDKRK